MTSAVRSRFRRGLRGDSVRSTGCSMRNKVGRHMSEDQEQDDFNESDDEKRVVG